MFKCLIGITFSVLLSSTTVDSYVDGGYVECNIRSYGVTTARQLQEAINRAKAGDTIKLDPIDYFGSFVINNNNINYITIDGDSQCNRNTRVIGDFNIKSNNWIIKDVVFLNSRKAIVMENANNIRLINLVINSMSENAIDVQNSNDIKFNNLVVDGVRENALEFHSVNNLYLSSLVLSNIGGVGILIDGSSNNLNILNTVSHRVNGEVIEITGNSNNGKIINTLITGDSPHGEAWISVDGNNFRIIGTVGNGAPKDGILVNGCGFYLNGNMCTMFGSNGHCIYLVKNNYNCYRLGWGNINIGGRAVVNWV